jgi:hypothetical protein
LAAVGRLRTETTIEEGEGLATFCLKMHLSTRRDPKVVVAPVRSNIEKGTFLVSRFLENSLPLHQRKREEKEGGMV